MAASNSDDFPISCDRFGFAISWERAGCSIDVDLQAVAFSSAGKLLNAVYYNNMKAFKGGMTHSGDEVTGERAGYDEVVWVNFNRLPSEVKLLAFVVACYRGGHLCDVPHGKYHLLENNADAEVFQAALENSDEEVDLLGMLIREDAGWMYRQVHVPAGDGQHFVDILEPTIGNCVREVIPEAPRRIKAAFAMDKGESVDLPKSSSLQRVFIGLGWDPGENDIDLDASVFLLSGAPGCGSVVAVDTVFFGNMEGQGVQHAGDNLTGEGEGDDERITVDLLAVAASVQQLCFTINIYTQGLSFGMVRNAYARVFTETGEELARYSLSEAGSLNGLVVARLFRAPDGIRWSFQALGMPCTGRTCKDSERAVCELCNQSAADFARQL